MASPFRPPVSKRELRGWTPTPELKAMSAYAAAVPITRHADHLPDRDQDSATPHSRLALSRFSNSSSAASNAPRVSPRLANAGHSLYAARNAGHSTGNPEYSTVGNKSSNPSGRPVQVSELDRREQTESWIKRPLYYTHHRKPKSEQLSQMIRLPEMQRSCRFKASGGASSWDSIAENAFQAMELHPLDIKKHINVVILLYCVPCNPFHLGDIDVLKIAKTSLEALPDVYVVGALVVPCSDAALRDKGIAEDRLLPYALRRDLACCVLDEAGHKSWTIVDTCMEGCMKDVPGSIAPFVSVYARGRLHHRGYETRLVEVRAEDPVTGSGSRDTRPFDHFHVSPGSSRGGNYAGQELRSRAGQQVTLDAIGTLIVDLPKQTQCDDLIWSSVRSPEKKEYCATLERFCGARGAQLIAEWAKNRGGR